MPCTRREAGIAARLLTFDQSLKHRGSSEPIFFGQSRLALADGYLLLRLLYAVCAATDRKRRMARTGCRSTPPQGIAATPRTSGRSAEYSQVGGRLEVDLLSQVGARVEPTATSPLALPSRKRCWPQGLDRRSELRPVGDVSTGGPDSTLASDRWLAVSRSGPQSRLAAFSPIGPPPSGVHHQLFS
jgi:hypothetical protein